MACLPAAALITRADRDDSEYLELATRYGASIRLPAPAGEGVLIAPRWIVTASAPAALLREIKPTPPVTVGGREHEIEAIHSDGEIALLQLATPVTHVKPVSIRREPDEAGAMVAIVAHGATGKQGSPRPTDGKRRAGINTVDAVTDNALELRIKSGDDASDLQGALAPGEAGAGAYVAGPDGTLLLAGIAQSTDGKREIYTRLSARLAWIEATMLEVARREAEKLLE